MTWHLISDIPNVPSGIKKRLEEWFKFKGIEELSLWPPQIDAINKGALTSHRFVLGMGTGSGKTLVAELAMLTRIYDRQMNLTGSKVLYLVPLKALASEKLREFRNKWGTETIMDKKWKHALEIYYLKSLTDTGDVDYKLKDEEKEMLKNGHIFIITYEKADVYLRNNPTLFNDVGLIVIDETHNLESSSRGHTIEMLIARLKTGFPDISILLLSATIGNIKEMADWLEYNHRLTEQKEGKYITEAEKDPWRPVELQKGLFLRNPIKKKIDDKITEYNLLYLLTRDKKIIETEIPVHKKGTATVKDPMIDLILDTITDNPYKNKFGESALVFVSTRRNAEAFAREVAKANDKFGKQNIHEKRILTAIANTLLKSPEMGETRVIYDPKAKKGAKDDLYSMFTSGVVFHHAGLKDDLRQVIELTYTGEIIDRLKKRKRIPRELKEVLDMYYSDEVIKNRRKLGQREPQLLRVVVATPTLESGVNLPATLVVVRQTTRWDSIFGKRMMLKIMEVLQMFGRAGRPGSKTIGRAVIYRDLKRFVDPERIDITTFSEWSRYIEGVPEPIDSKLTFLNDRMLLQDYANEVHYPEEIYDVASNQEIQGASFQKINLVKQILASVYMNKKISSRALKDLLSTSFYWYTNTTRTDTAAEKGNRSMLREKLVSMSGKASRFLHDHQMVKIEYRTVGDKKLIDTMEITDFGGAVAKLYMDPMFAGYALEGAKRFNDWKIDDLMYLHLLCMEETANIAFLKDAELKKYESELSPMYINPPGMVESPEDKDVLIPGEDFDFEEYLRYYKAYKSAQMLEMWINEYPVQYICDLFRIYESDLYQKYTSTQRTSILVRKLGLADSKRAYYCGIMSNRLRKGIKRELVSLCSIRNIGRVRGRNLYSSGFFDMMCLLFPFIKYDIDHKTQTVAVSELSTEYFDIKQEKRTIKDLPDGIPALKVYNAIEVFINQHKRLPKDGEYHVPNMTPEEIRNALATLVKHKYVRRITVPVLKEMIIDDKTTYEFINVDKHVITNDYLILTKIIGKGILESVLEYLYTGKSGKWISDRKLALLGIVKEAISKVIHYHDEVTDELVIEYLKGKDKELRIGDQTKELVVNRIIRKLRQSINKLLEEKKAKAAVHEILRMPDAANWQVFNAIEYIITEAEQVGKKEPEEIYPTVEDIIGYLIRMDKQFRDDEEGTRRLVEDTVIVFEGEFVEKLEVGLDTRYKTIL